MTLRVLLAVVVTVALLASAVPAIEEAQRFRAEQELSDSAARVEHAATTLVRRNDPVPPGVPAATKRVRVTVPERPGGAVLRVGRLPIPSSSSTGPGTGVSTKVQGKPPTRYPVDAAIRVSSADPQTHPGTLVLREDAVLTLEYRLVDGRPAVVVTRGFKSGNRTSQAHVATVPGDR